MKNKLDINKEDLWGKIIEDDRMPKKESRLIFGRNIWGGLILLVLLFTGISYLFIVTELQKENNQSPQLTQNESKSTIKSNPSRNQEVTIQDQSTSGHIEKDKHADVKSIQSQIQKSEPVSDFANNNSAESPSSNGALKSIQHTDQSNYKDIHIHASDDSNNNSSNERTPIETIGQYEEVQESASQIILDETDSRSKRIEHPIEDSKLITPKSGNLSISEESDLMISEDSRKMSEVVGLPLSNQVKLISEKHKFNLQLGILNDQNAKSKRRINFFYSLGYGLGFRNSKDGNGKSYGDESPFGNSLQSYQIEIGMSRKLGSWGARVGLGADIMEGNGRWTNVDTVYNLFSESSTYERIENTTLTKLYQRYGNIYFTVGIDYEFKSSTWSIVPRLGIKYHLMNLSNGTTITNGTFNKQVITGAESRNQVAFSMGIELQRKLTDRFRLTLYTKYETGVTYQLTPDLHQSVSSLYFGLGGEFSM